MREVRLGRNGAVFVPGRNGAVRDDADGAALVVADGEALEAVEAGQPGTRDLVELAPDPAARPGEGDEVGDAVGPADQGVWPDGDPGAEECGVVSGDEVAHERVVVEAPLEGSVGED